MEFWRPVSYLIFIRVYAGFIGGVNVPVSDERWRAGEGKEEAESEMENKVEVEVEEQVEIMGGEDCGW